MTIFYALYCNIIIKICKFITLLLLIIKGYFVYTAAILPPGSCKIVQAVFYYYFFNVCMCVCVCVDL